MASKTVPEPCRLMPVKRATARRGAFITAESRETPLCSPDPDPPLGMNREIDYSGGRGE